MEVMIREYNKNDFSDVNDILVEAFLTKKKEVPTDNFFEVVAEVDNKVVGYLLLTRVLNPIKDRYYFLVDYVCVSKEYRNLGIGKKMLDYAYKVAKKNDAIYLQLTCGYFRKAAHKLYESCGYKIKESDLYRKDVI